MTLKEAKIIQAWLEDNKFDAKYVTMTRSEYGDTLELKICTLTGKKEYMIVELAITGDPNEF
jgi:hypothetical protein